MCICMLPADWPGLAGSCSETPSKLEQVSCCAGLQRCCLALWVGFPVLLLPDGLQPPCPPCPQIPFYGSYTETDPAIIAQQGVERFKKEGR